MNPAMDSCGYRVFSATSGGQSTQKKTLKVHREVLKAFAGPCPPGMVACHANGDRQDNRAANLRWDTYKANARDRQVHAAIQSTEWEPGNIAILDPKDPENGPLAPEFESADGPLLALPPAAATTPICDHPPPPEPEFLLPGERLDRPSE